MAHDPNEIPDLRPHLLPRGHIDADGARCSGHCDHVGFMWRDFKRMEKALWFFFAAVVALIVKDVVPAMMSKGRENTALIHDGERLGPDRVAEPRQ